MYVFNYLNNMLPNTPTFFPFLIPTEQQQKSQFICRGTLYANLRDICVKSKCKISQIWT